MIRQFVYRREVSTPFEIRNGGPGILQLHECPASALSMWGALRASFGFRGAVKLLAKLATPSRRFYCILHEGEIVSHGFLSVSFCRFYPVEKGSIVIGPVWTRPECRGRGLATRGLMGVINAMVSHGLRVFYIDTSETNIAMQRVIAKCGFGVPIQEFTKKG